MHSMEQNEGPSGIWWWMEVQGLISQSIVHTYMVSECRGMGCKKHGCICAVWGMRVLTCGWVWGGWLNVQPPKVDWMWWNFCALTWESTCPPSQCCFVRCCHLKFGGGLCSTLCVCDVELMQLSSSCNLGLKWCKNWGGGYQHVNFLWTVGCGTKPLMQCNVGLSAQAMPWINHTKY